MLASKWFLPCYLAMLPFVKLLLNYSCQIIKYWKRCLLKISWSFDLRHIKETCTQYTYLPAMCIITELLKISLSSWVTKQAYFVELTGELATKVDLFAAIIWVWSGRSPSLSWLTVNVTSFTLHNGTWSVMLHVTLRLPWLSKNGLVSVTALPDPDAT